MPRTSTATSAGKSSRTKGGTSKKTTATKAVGKKVTKKASTKAVAKKTTKKATTKKVGPKKTVVKKASKPKTAKKSATKTVTKKTAKKTVAKDKSKKPKQLREKTDKTFHALFKLTPQTAPEKDTYPQDTVSVPQGPSARVLSRVAALRATMQTLPIDRTMRNLAYIGGRISIVAGAAVTSLSLASASLVPLATQPAEVIDAVTATTTDGGSTTEPLTSTITPNTLVVEFDVDDILSDEHEIVVTANGGEYVDAYLKNIETNTYHALDLRDDVPDQNWWLFRARVAELPPGYYVVVAKVHLSEAVVPIESHRIVVDPVATNSGSGTANEVSATTSEASSTDGSTQAVLDPVVEIADIPDVIDGIHTVDVRALYVKSVNVTLRDIDRTRAVRLVETDYDDFNETYFFKLDSTLVPDGKYDLVVRATSESGEIVSYESNSFEIENVTYEESVTADENTVETDSEDAVIEQAEENVPESDDLQVVEKSDEPELLIKLDNIRSTERYKIIAMSAPGASFVEVYARPIIATQPQFLGLASRVDSEGKFVYSIDATKLPNGTYIITGRTKIEGELYTTPRLELVLYTAPVVKEVVAETKEVIESTTTVAPAIDKVTTIVKEEQITTPTVSEVVEEGGSVDAKDDVSEETTTDTVAIETKALFDEYKERIEAALQRYTTALRSGDEEAIRRTRVALEELTSEMVLALYQSERARDYVDDIEARIKTLIERLATQTETTEIIIKTRTNDAISIDSDGDGITDYDEIEIYKTDPNNADSDQDGFVDGAEVLSGFNPNDPAYEAVIAYGSPKESGVVREDVLEVAEIVPVVKPVVPVAGDEPVIEVPQEVEIRGKALPNSFVTLYIYSTPIIVTVKTADDGSWSYTLDKELEDGEHEVYVGMTDNTGAVIAKSNPFRFVKEAEAFSPVDAVSAATVTVTPDEPLAPATSTATILGLTLLVIGLLLILMGYYLERMRPEEDEVVAVPA